MNERARQPKEPKPLSSEQVGNLESLDWEVPGTEEEFAEDIQRAKRLWKENAAPEFRKLLDAEEE